MLFSEIIGQSAVKQQLVQSVQNNRLSHAMILVAPEGAGGLPIGLAFTQYLVCENKQATDACGQCAACVKASQYIHPDIHYSYPVIPRKSGDKPISTDYINEWREFIGANPYGNAYDWLQFIGAENKQGNITASECQDILHKLNLKSFESGYKILLMWMPEYLGNEGNRLLKLIEEPPQNTLFILVAENQEQILATILSRTHLVKVGGIQKEDLVKALEQKNQVPAQKAQQLATIALGNYREALFLLRNSEDDYHELLRNWLNHLFTGNRIALQEWIEAISSAKTGRENQKQFLRYFINLIEHTIRLQYLDKSLLGFSPEEIDFATKLSKLANHEQLAAIAEELNNASYYIERNANGKLLFHALSIKLQHIFKKKPIPVL
ncbi:DNA polymerase-3 subunit delta' [Chitinophaga terrae (ex Kim and Jung 2007)]|uniref:DNA polymerase-3 subunit delta n=1 Tax=Chitinophaga terrae (ex Kim and Jung 2007) TaxID=408074 RepID=A0A1H4GI95_9BACT|nr:DNA polymerase III subunit delta' [Chitinophaga terrae (ex Kim and Jung 2007)]MDQ0105569.1 DNA polymerase-3 subunit delta' [Chitinophaga terrae (ex Kim and Jung 2007)]GEP93473.1 DNA polymerase III subunit delta [Chitinophaga terrae (ex Kim and Jung 2007)]SEB09274.1 DNA polymerase-3 subunit delta' [Chitinophaga terrae (ex Kim and Jung 2007)]